MSDPHPTAKPDGGEHNSDREDYYESIELMADVIEEEYDPDGRPLAEWVFEEVDSSGWILHFHKNTTVLDVSDNNPFEWKHLVAEDDNWREVLQAMAFDTMRQDLWDELRERGVGDL